MEDFDESRKLAKDQSTSDNGVENNHWHHFKRHN